MNGITLPTTNWFTKFVRGVHPRHFDWKHQHLPSQAAPWRLVSEHTYRACILFMLIFAWSLGDRTAMAQAEPLIDRFWKEYPKAVERLESALNGLRGNGRFRVSKGGAQGRWVELEFLVDDENLRFHRRFGGNAASDSPTPEIALLETPKLHSIVENPNSLTAWITSISRESLPKIRLDRAMHFDRFLRASYCLDDVSILDQITKGVLEVRSVSMHPNERDWVVVDYVVNSAADDGDLASGAEGQLILSPREDWCIREHSYMRSPPAGTRLQVAVSVASVDGAGFVVNSYRHEISRTLPGLGAAAGISETWQFELQRCTAQSIDSDEFELSALGVENPFEQRNFLSLVVVLLVISSLGLLVVRKVRLFSSNSRPVRWGWVMGGQMVACHWALENRPLMGASKPASGCD